MDNAMLKVEEMLSRTIEQVPDLIENLLESTGQKIYKQVVSNINADTKTKTGNLKNSPTLVVKSGYTAVRANYKKAPHTHLIENGHKKRSKTASVTNFVPGKHSFRNAYLTLNNELIADGQTVAEKIKAISEER